MRFNRFYLIENRALSLAENTSKQTRNLELFCFDHDKLNLQKNSVVRPKHN